MMMEKYEKAWEIAKAAHEGQKRFNGQPYITHIQEVVKILEGWGYRLDFHILIPAILHDVIEDGGDQYYSIISYKIGSDVARIVNLLTHRKGDSYLEYIDSLCSDETCVIIKIVDMIHNLTDCPSVKQRAKYRDAFPFLLQKLSEHKCDECDFRRKGV